jgi:hypothetical protein
LFTANYHHFLNGLPEYYRTLYRAAWELFAEPGKLSFWFKNENFLMLCCVNESNPKRSTYLSEKTQIEEVCLWSHWIFQNIIDNKSQFSNFSFQIFWYKFSHFNWYSVLYQLLNDYFSHFFWISIIFLTYRFRFSLSFFNGKEWLRPSVLTYCVY